MVFTDVNTVLALTRFNISALYFLSSDRTRVELLKRIFTSAYMFRMNVTCNRNITGLPSALSNHRHMCVCYALALDYLFKYDWELQKRSGYISSTF